MNAKEKTKNRKLSEAMRLAHIALKEATANRPRKGRGKGYLVITPEYEKAVKSYQTAKKNHFRNK